MTKYSSVFNKMTRAQIGEKEYVFSAAQAGRAQLVLWGSDALQRGGNSTGKLQFWESLGQHDM